MHTLNLCSEHRVFRRRSNVFNLEPMTARPVQSNSDNDQADSWWVALLWRWWQWDEGQQKCFLSGIQSTKPHFVDQISVFIGFPYASSVPSYCLACGIWWEMTVYEHFNWYCLCCVGEVSLLLGCGVQEYFSHFQLTKPLFFWCKRLAQWSCMAWHYGRVCRS